MSGYPPNSHPDGDLTTATRSFAPESELQDSLAAFNLSGASSLAGHSFASMQSKAPVLPNNTTPEQLRFTLNQSSYTSSDRLEIRNGWVLDEDGAIDLDRIDLEILQNNTLVASLGSVNNIAAAAWDDRWASFSYETDMETLGLNAGEYSISAIAYDDFGAASAAFERNFKIVSHHNSTPNSPRFSLNQSTYNLGEILEVNNGWAFDADGAIDLQKVGFSLENASDNRLILVSETENFNTASWDENWASFSHAIDLTGLDTGDYILRATLRDRANNQSESFARSFVLEDPIIANNNPDSLRFTLDKILYNSSDTLTLKNAWIRDLDGADDLDRLAINIWKNGSERFASGTIFNLTPASWSHQWASFNYNLNLNEFGSGGYTFEAIAYDKLGATSNRFTRDFQVISPEGNFSNFDLFDASGDTTATTAFQSGALRLNYSLENVFDLDSVRLEAWQNDSIFATLGTWKDLNASNTLIDLANFNLTGGTYDFRVVANTLAGDEISSLFQQFNILNWQESATNFGTIAGETLTYTDIAGTGNIFIGRGGTDTLELGLARSEIMGINGIDLANYDPFNSTSKQAIFQGTAFDFITLNNGNEIYFQGIERLQFTNDDFLELQVTANDTYLNQQWNLRVSDVESAWRFNRGSEDVLLVTLDTGILSEYGSSQGVYDLDLNDRLITDPTDVDGFANYGHGHSATTIMAATSNNNFGVTGINWHSDVYVTNVYEDGVDLQTAIRDAIAYAQTNNQRVVFQTGIQGEYWLTNGGTQAQLEDLLRENADTALFAVAAGNGGEDIDIPEDIQLSGGMARLQTTHENVMAIGALRKTGTTTIDGLTNATRVDRADYSNYGASLTLMAATDSPAMNKFGNRSTFGGTSAANPNMAGIASLVWSANSNLNASELRQILIDTAIDLTETRSFVTAGERKDDAFGHGLVNADAAVRRAVALSRDGELANLYNGRSQFA